MSESKVQAVLAAMTPQIYERFKRAVELRKWPDGNPVSNEQLQTCLQAIIAYEHHHFPPEQRTGYVPPKTEPCVDDSHIHTHETPLKWRE
jgi:Uncharacterized protein conserved in bacteria